MQTGAPVGMILAALCGGLLSPVIGWRACFALSVLPALIVIAIRRYLPESDVWVKARTDSPVTQVPGPGIRDFFSRNYRDLLPCACPLGLRDVCLLVRVLVAAGISCPAA